MIHTEHVSYDWITENFSVSLATVRNWVKCGYLHTTGKGLVSYTSFSHFQNNILGKEKLHSRANKLLLDTHNHDELIKNIAEKKYATEQLSSIYEKGLSSSYRNKEGIFYTHENIIKDFFEKMTDDINDSMTFCDPCCGTGNFLLGAIEAGFVPENIYGFDIDKTALNIAQKRIFERTGCYAHLKHIDTLEQCYLGKTETYNVIMTNPPWGKKYSKNIKNNFSRIFQTGKSMDSSAFFIALSILCTKENGFIGLLLPDSCFSVSAFADIREKILEKEIVSLVDYKKPFKGLMASSVGLFLKNKKSTSNNIVCCSKYNDTTSHARLQHSFTRNWENIFNIDVIQEEQNTIEYLLSLKHITLANNARWGLGIVTGNNSKFFSKKEEEGYMPILRGKDIHNKCIEVPKLFIPKNVSLYQQVADIDLYTANSKLVYRFISSKLIFAHDTKRHFLLNSANLVIPSIFVPIKHSVLADYLSSDFMNWLYSSLFKTNKVLRKNLEYLPIYHEVLSKETIFKKETLYNYLGIEETKNGNFRSYSIA